MNALIMISPMKVESFKNELKNHWDLPEISDQNLSISIGSIKLPRVKMPVFFKRNSIAFGTWGGRTVVYSDGSKVNVQKKSSRSWEFVIDSESPLRRLELGKLCYLSVFGLLQELNGQMRLHCAGFYKKEKMFVFWGKPGSGKTTLSNYILEFSKVLISSDELMFYDGHFIQGVPLKFALKNVASSLIPIPQSRRVAKALPKKLFCLQLHQEKMISRSATVWEKFHLSVNLVLGVGLHQMIEFHFTFRNLPLWFQIFRTRLIRTQQLFKQVKICILHPRSINLIDSL